MKFDTVKFYMEEEFRKPKNWQSACGTRAPRVSYKPVGK